jgi:WD40 repeat protein
MEIKNIENVITIHFDSVVNCIKILNDGNLILTLKNLLKIYSKIFYEEIMNIQIFEGNIFYVTQLKNNNIVACDNNKSIKIIKLKIEEKNFEIIQNINNAHNWFITKVKKLLNNKIISICADKSFKIWNLNEKTNQFFCDFYLNEKNFILDCLQLNEKILLYSTTAFKKDILIKYDLINKEKDDKIKKIRNENMGSIINVNNIKLLNNNYVVYLNNYYVSIVDLNKFFIVKEIKMNQFKNYYVFVSKENEFLVGNENGEIFKFLWNDNNLIVQFVKSNAENSKINKIIKINNKMIGTCSDSNNVKIFYI